MASTTSNTTKDHDEIRRWAEERGGKPAHVAKTGSTGDLGILRIEFPGAPGSNDGNLEELSWDQFFEKFDERGLALLYQEQTAAGAQSNFNKLISAETAETAGSRSTSRKRSGGAGTNRSRSTAGKKVSVKKTAAKKVSNRPPAKKKAVKKAAKGTKSSSARKAAPAKKKATSSKNASSRNVKKSSASAGRPAGRKAVKKSTGRKRR